MLTLQLHFILHHERLPFVVYRLGKLGRDGMMGSGILDNETLVTDYARHDGSFFDGPFSHIGPILVGLGVFFLGM
jgi:hypothetical protein